MRRTISSLAAQQRVKVAPYTTPMAVPRSVQDMIRVDYAGEMAAVRICEAQLWWVSPLSATRLVVDEILEEERYHRSTMEELCRKYAVTPTAADSIFSMATFGMGLGTAILGEEAIMCCHAAVEDTITDHYNSQLRDIEELRSDNLGSIGVIDELSNIVASFRDDEQHHKEMGEVNGAAKAPFYHALYPSIQTACSIGILIASKI